MIKKFNLFVIAALLMGFTACNDSEKGTAKLNIKLTDAPADYEEVNIDIQDVKINPDSDEEGWVSMNKVEKGIYNLLEFTGGLSIQLASDELPAGYYNQIRLVLGDNNSLMVDGQEHALTIPSGSSSGLKLNLHQTLVEGVVYDVLLDFDAARSIIQTGNGAYKLKPVIRMMMEASTGSIVGTVNPANAGGYAQAVPVDKVDTDISEDADVATAYIDEEGKFVLQGIAPDTYQVTIIPSTESGLVEKVIDDVIVTLGEATDLGTIELAD